MNEPADKTPPFEPVEVSILRLGFLTPDATGLPIKRHNAAVRLLQKMASRSFSDGTKTNTGKIALGKVLGRKPRTIARQLRDAESIGAIESEPRFGVRGQQVSSARTIIWTRIIELTKNVSPLDLIPVSNDTAPMSPDTAPVSPDTPCSPSSPDKNQSKLKSKGKQPLDYSFKKGKTRSNGATAARRSVTDAVIARRAFELFTRLRYVDHEGQTIWLAAAVHVGLLSEHEVYGAADAVANSATSPQSIPGYFRKTLAEKAGLTMGELSDLLSQVRVTPRLPKSKPKRCEIEGDNARVHSADEAVAKLQGESYRPILQRPPEPGDANAERKRIKRELQKVTDIGTERA